MAWYRLAIDLTVLVHFLFILFVIFGALLAQRSPVVKWLHWASLSYALLIEIFYWYCPLTLLEYELRRRAAIGAYEESFLTHYLKQLIYWDVPQWMLILAAATVVALNLVFYARLRRRERSL